MLCGLKCLQTYTTIRHVLVGGVGGVAVEVLFSLVGALSVDVLLLQLVPGMVAFMYVGGIKIFSSR